MKFLIYSLIIIYSNLLLAKVQEEIEIDLRNTRYAPYRNQYFFKLSPSEDSQFCHAMTLANLVGQVTKIAISPDDIAYQVARADIYNEQIGESPFGSELAGFLSDDWKVLNDMGFCKQDDLNLFLDKLSQQKNENITYVTTQELYTFGKSNQGWKVANMAEFLMGICKDRIKIRDFKLTKITLNDLQSSSEEKKKEFFQNKIDQALNSSKFVGYLYQGHYVTIIGRTKTHKYLIQDSIPRNEWLKLDSFNQRQREFSSNGGAIEFLDENLQIWPKETILNYVEEIDFLTSI